MRSSQPARTLGGRIKANLEHTVRFAAVAEGGLDGFEGDSLGGAVVGEGGEEEGAGV